MNYVGCAFHSLRLFFCVCCAYVEDFSVVRYLSEMEVFEGGGCCMLLVSAIEWVERWVGAELRE